MRWKQAKYIALLWFPAACSSPKPSPNVPGPVAGATTATAPDIACPDNTDTPQIIEYMVGVRYRAFKQNPANLLPGCYVEAVGARASSAPDSIVSMTLEMSDALYARQPDDPANLAGRVALLTRSARYREVPATFDRMVRLDPSKASLANYRLALAAAMRGNDSTARLRYLTAAAKKYPSAQSIVADYNIQRQIPRLRALIDSTQQILRLAPSRTAAYATLASIYGNLDVPDSALHYTRRALQAGLSRNEVAPSLQSLIGVTMRKAQLIDDPQLWLRTLTVAARIDSALSTDASKHLLALSFVQVASYYVTLAREALGGSQAEVAMHTQPLADAATRAKACQAVRLVPGFLDSAKRALDQGGARFSTESVPAIRSGIAIIRTQQTQVAQRCPT
jgi:tetratricopeptide (TPR) repeat protein